MTVVEDVLAVVLVVVTMVVVVEVMKDICMGIGCSSNSFGVQRR